RRPGVLPRRPGPSFGPEIAHQSVRRLAQPLYVHAEKRLVLSIAETRSLFEMGQLNSLNTTVVCVGVASRNWGRILTDALCRSGRFGLQSLQVMRLGRGQTAAVALCWL